MPSSRDLAEADPPPHTAICPEDGCLLVVPADAARPASPRPSSWPNVSPGAQRPNTIRNVRSRWVAERSWDPAHRSTPTTERGGLVPWFRDTYSRSRVRQPGVAAEREARRPDLRRSRRRPGEAHQRRRVGVVAASVGAYGDPVEGCLEPCCAAAGGDGVAGAGRAPQAAQVTAVPAGRTGTPRRTFRGRLGGSRGTGVGRQPCGQPQPGGTGNGRLGELRGTPHGPQHHSRGTRDDAQRYAKRPPEVRRDGPDLSTNPSTRDNPGTQDSNQRTPAKPCKHRWTADGDCLHCDRHEPCSECRRLARIDDTIRCHQHQDRQEAS